VPEPLAFGLPRLAAIGLFATAPSATPEGESLMNKTERILYSMAIKLLVSALTLSPASRIYWLCGIGPSNRKLSVH